MEHADIIIVGAGHGGAQAAIALRQNGFEGSILMIGRDYYAPYERPPLSKEYFAREKDFERIYIRPPKFWEDKNVTLKLGSVVTKIQPSENAVVLSDDSQITYGQLIWATGGYPRRLSCPGAEADGIYAVRDRADVDKMMEELDRGARKVAVVGGGYIGLEAAAVLRKLDCEVTLIEALPRVLARVAGEELSEFFHQQHREHGVDLRLGEGLERFEAEDGRVTGVKLESGETIACDFAVVGIGIVPAVGPLISAGASGSNGVDVDQYCRTGIENIYAIGDCAAHANDFADGAVIRLESVQNANDMATTAAKHICGEKTPYRALPWFWSNQYDLKLQTAGLSIGYNEVVMRGDPDSRSFSVIYLKDGVVIALDCVNAVKDYVQGRKLVEAKVEPDKELLADVETPLKQLL